MSSLFDRLAAVAAPEQLVGVAVRDLREPAKTTSTEYRGLHNFVWVDASELGRLPEVWGRMLTPRLLAQWRWVHDVCGGPARCASHRYLHGVRLDGVPMLRPVTCATEPANGGGTIDELTGVLGLPIDLDVAERRCGDHRRYCPTISDGLAFLHAFAPSVVLDAGGGLVAVWLFTEPAAPRAARRLGEDLVAAIKRAASARGWAFDSPAPHAAWVKAPGCLDLFRGHVTVEVAAGEPWRFHDLRAAVPYSARRRGTWRYQSSQEEAS